MDLEALFQNRSVEQLSLSQLIQHTRSSELASTAWYVNGGHARPKDEPMGFTGKIPALTQETKTQVQVSPNSLPNGSGDDNGAHPLVPTATSVSISNNHHRSAASASASLES